MKRQFTVSTYIIHKEKILLVFHPKLQKWLPPGGHVEENETPPQAAKREILEETGLEVEWIENEHVWVNRWNAKSFHRPYLCLLEEIPAHKDEPAHQHMDFIYLAKPTSQNPKISTEEDHAIQWFSLEEILKLQDDKEIFLETKQVIQSLLQMEYV